MHKPDEFLKALLDSIGGEENIVIRHVPLSDIFGDMASTGLGAAFVGEPDEMQAYDEETQVGPENPLDADELDDAEDCPCFNGGEILGYAKALAFINYGVRWGFLDEDEQDSLTELACVQLSMI